MARPVKCVYCGVSFDRDKEDFVPVKNRYAHKACAEAHQKNDYIEGRIHEKMAYLLGAEYSKTRINNQIKEMLAEGKTVVGIYNALIYWYDVLGKDPQQARGSIRIVNFIYGQAQEYWMEKSLNKQRNLNLDIDKIKNPEVETYRIKPKPIRRPKRVKLFDLQ